jgi:hypothetical protein
MPDQVCSYYTLHSQMTFIIAARLVGRHALVLTRVSVEMPTRFGIE